MPDFVDYLDERVELLRKAYADSVDRTREAFPVRTIPTEPTALVLLVQLVNDMRKDIKALRGDLQRARGR